MHVFYPSISLSALSLVPGTQLLQDQESLKTVVLNLITWGKCRKCQVLVIILFFFTTGKQ